MTDFERNSSVSKWKVADILGSEVYDSDGSFLGLLTDVMSTGSNDVWTIKSEDEEILIPALKSIVLKVEVLEKKIFVNLPEGYADIYGTKVKLDQTVAVAADDFCGYYVYED